MGQYSFDRLKDNKEFENLIVDYYRKYELSSQGGIVALYGRNGQKQYGIDITVQTKNELWCIQCKNKTSISVSDIDEIIKKCTFYKKQPFQRLIIATAAMNDTKVNTHLLEVNCSKKIPYAIEYLPWDRICDFIGRSPEIYQKYYKNLELDDPLRKKFFELLKRYEILAFIKIDPISEGLSENIPENVDRFVSEIQKELNDHPERNDIVYRNIYEFREEINNYNTDLSVILFLNQSYDRYVYLPPYNGVDLKFKEKNEMVEKYRKTLSQLFMQIKLLGGNSNPISETER